MSDALESFYNGLLNNVVLRDINNRPSIFVKHIKQNSNDFDPEAAYLVDGVAYPCLPEHTHPAFIVNGVEDPALLIGKYQGVELTPHGTIYSLPNAEPVPVHTYNENLANMRAFGRNASGMTVADHGLLVLMAHKNKWITYGNTRNGNDWRDGNQSPPWRNGPHASSGFNGHYYVGNTVLTDGYVWECIKEHDSSNSTAPYASASYWKKVRKTGGTVVPGHGSKVTYTGSGPVSWYFGHDLENEADIGGNGDAWLYGVLIGEGEIRILPNNDAADPNADLTSTSSAWRAIKPCEPTEANGYTNYTLVAVNGTDTCRYAYINGKIRLVDKPWSEITGAVTGAELNTPFKDLTVYSGAESIQRYGVPTILYELGLFPLPGTTVDGRMDLSFKTNSLTSLSFGRNPTQGENIGLASYRPMGVDNGVGDSNFSTRPRARVLS